MKTKFLYYAIFSKEDDGSYMVQFPGMDGCMTFGRSLEEAYEKAIDACAGWLLVAKKTNKKVPELNIQTKSLKHQSDKAFYSLIFVDLADFYKKINRKSVKKNLTIPYWLSEIADERKINYSKVLQEALQKMIGVD